MLRAVLIEVEAVLYSSSILRGGAVVCGHPFEFGVVTQRQPVRSVVGARLEAERGVLAEASWACLSAKGDRADLGFGTVRVGRVGCPLRPMFEGWGLVRALGLLGVE